MITMSALKIQLAAVRSTLIQMPVFSSGRPDDDGAALKLATRLDEIKGRLEIILRDLKSSDSQVRVQSENLRKVPLEHRWSAQDSVKQRTRDIAEAMEEAQKLADLVKDLLAKNGLITPIQAGQKTGDLLKDLEKQLPVHTKASTLHLTNQPEFTAAPGEPLHLESLGPLIALIYFAIRYWKDKSSSKKS